MEGRGRARVRMRGGIGEGGEEGGRGRARGRGRGRLQAGGGEAQRRRGPTLSNEIRATLVDHVVNHGLTVREAGLRVQPNLSRFTVASVIRAFRLENRIEGRVQRGGRAPIFTPLQEREIVNMVLANNAIRLREIQAKIIEDQIIFQNVNQVSLSTIARILKAHQVQMKQMYRVPFERNSERVKQLRHEYVETRRGFNLSKVRRRGRNVIGQRAIISVPGQRGGNITLCAAITQNGVLHRHANMGPYKTPHILTFLDRVYNLTIINNMQIQYVVIWDNVSFHRSELLYRSTHISQSFSCHHILHFLTQLKNFSRHGGGKVYDLHPLARVALIQAMEEACDQIEATAIQGWDTACTAILSPLSCK
ncbi:hypothetical protein N1851_028828 [Merluccius polli]|uniref:Tc1-like transposase DDE domain-containing protein n=1 Tax=Merluccius polli TaxID=89951 RepID=A0AA47NS34_MERPO|nr:hypothetical protein N1851_028828 [Merluccius polli]